MAGVDSITATQRAREDRAIYKALRLLEGRMRNPGEQLSSPLAVRQFLTLNLAGYDREVFSALWLDSQNRLISAEHLFFGTLTQTSVYPREVLRRGLLLNAAGVVFAHNHPSGVASPSQSDLLLTSELIRILGQVEIRVLDHFVVAGTSTISLAEHGLLGADKLPGIEPAKKRRKRPVSA